MNTQKLASVVFALLLVVTFSSFKTTTEPTFEEIMAADYVSTTCSETLKARFELQFSNLLKDVTQVDVHYNENNGFYYAVKAYTPEGEPFTEYFKTTEKEVAAGTYDYIGLNDESKSMTAGKACREDFDNIPNWCTVYNRGPICGYSTRWGCIYY